MPLIVDAAKRDLNMTIEWGRQKMQDGAYEAAIPHFNMALEMRPGFMQALVSRGFCYLTLGDEERAQRDFVEVINKDAGFNRNIYILMALCCKRSGNFQTAIRYLNRCITQFPTFKAALMARGELCLKVQDFERARADFRQVLDQSPSHLVARRGHADALRGLSHFREALRQYQRAISDALQALEHLQEQQQKHREENCSAEISEEDRSRDDFQGNQQQSFQQQQHNNSNFDRGENDDGNAYTTQSSNLEADDDEHCKSDHRQASLSSSALEEGAGAVEPEEQLLSEPEQLRTFLIELLIRRALCFRLIGQLDQAGQDLLEVLEMEPQEGLALFWYGKVLIEQLRHQEASSFLQAALQYHEDTRPLSHALLGALLMTRPDPDFQSAQRHLQEAARLAPSSQPVRVTLWICSAAVAVHCTVPRDAKGALELLEKAKGALETNDLVTVSSGGGCRSARGPRPRTPTHVAGSGAAAVLTARAGSKSAEEVRWSATRALVRRQQELAQGDDLEQSVQCRTFLQLVAQVPQQRAAEVPPMLFQLRVPALCELCRWDEAVADCRRALALDSGDEDTQYTMHVASGILRSQASKFEAAIGCFTKAIRLQPVSTEARLHRAIVLACAARAQGSGEKENDKARAIQLLTDAVQDLEAVDQQAMIAGNATPLGASHLCAACLCSLGRPEDAWEVLCESGRHCVGRRSSTVDGRDDPSVARQRALEAEVLVLLRRHNEAIEACSAVLALNSRGHAEARLMRGWCLSELGDVEAAFEDLTAALSMSPDRSDVHEASGDLNMAHDRLSEAYAAYVAASRLAEPPDPRIAYKRALPQLAMGQLSLANQELHKALRMSPQMPAAIRARDGVQALQTALKEDWRHAHVRINMMLHQNGASVIPSAVQLALSSGSDALPVIFLPHELMLYRGVCSLYLGDLSTAIQDFATSVELCRQLAAAAEEADWQKQKPLRWLPVEVSSRQGLAFFELECLFNISLCHLRARDYVAALVSIDRLLERQEDLAAYGISSQGLIWFLAGICHLALEGDELPRDQLAREAFTRSFSYDASFVDDFLRRHTQSNQQEMHPMPPQRPKQTLRPIGGCPVPVRIPPREREGCNVAPSAVCSLRRGPAMTSVPSAVSDPPGDQQEQRSAEDQGASTEFVQHGGNGHSQTLTLDEGVEQGGTEIVESGNAGSHSSDVVVVQDYIGGGGSRCSSGSTARRRSFSDLLPPLRLQVRDVTIWGRPSACWPHVRPPDWTPPTNLARLDLLQQRDHGALPTLGGRGGA
eukprot:TRINITY_DN17877_c0_g1_i2.p1 TRINITY_DN17877_c0_g1~~TRINITY_DN17877_c0_g1_i2.p1  ORF type:complete len:1271 (+),score=275.91 TRINITY_DN17877_c0_g1_i2:115-3927(+)